MEDLGEKFGRGVFWGMLILCLPLFLFANFVAKILEIMGINNPPHDSGNDIFDNPYQP